MTGASSGIGRAVAVGLAAVGGDVCGVGRRRPELDATAACATGRGSVTAHPADLSVVADIAALARELRASGSGLDVLVHSAGAFSMGRLDTAPVEELDRQYATNVRGPYLLTQALLPMLRERRGQIVFVNSTIVFGARAGVGQFAATQHALKGIADVLREEVNAEGIRVVTVYVGRTATPRQARIYAREDRPYTPERLLQPADVAEVVLDVLALPRSAEATDVRVRPMLKHH